MDIALSDLALDGGRAATKWQKQHAQRKAREARLQLRRLTREEAKADLKKRTKKWRQKWKAKAAANKATGLPPPSRHGRPRDVAKNFLDMTGWRFGRLTVLRVAPVSKNGAQRCRTWWVKCDCGSPERRVNGTTLRQGNSRSCGCLVRERLRGYFEDQRTRKAALQSAPLSVRLDELRHRIIHKNRITRADAMLLRMVRAIVVEGEVAQGVRRRERSGRAILAKPAGVKPRPTGKAALRRRVH